VAWPLLRHVRHRATPLAATLAERDVARLIAPFMDNVPQVDLAGAELLVGLRADGTGRGATLDLTEVRGQVREALGRSQTLTSCTHTRLRSEPSRSSRVSSCRPPASPAPTMTRESASPSTHCW
jgi:hypothetical protein